MNSVRATWRGWVQRAAEATAPMRGRLAPAIGFGKELLHEYSDDEVSVWAGALTYRFFLALFPFFIFLAAVAGFVTARLGVTDPTQQAIDLLGRVMPAEASQVLGSELGKVIGTQSAGLLSFGLIFALWAASSGVRDLMRAMNKAYDIEESRPPWRKYPLALAMTVAGGIFVLLGTAVFFTGEFFIADIFRALDIEGGWVVTLVAWSRWPIVFLVMLAGMSLLYSWVPNASLPLKLVLPGAALFVVIWLIATTGLSWYVGNFSSYNATYGTLGGVVVLLLWIYVSSTLLLVGAEVNAIIVEHVDPRRIQHERRLRHAEVVQQEREKGQ